MSGSSENGHADSDDHEALCTLRARWRLTHDDVPDDVLLSAARDTLTFAILRVGVAVKRVGRMLLAIFSRYF